MKIFNQFKVLPIAGMISALAMNALSLSNEPLSFSHQNSLLYSADTTLSALDNEQLRSRTVQQLLSSGAQRPTAAQYAEPREVSISPNSQWSVMAANQTGASSTMAVWRKTITSPGALSLNLGFKKFHMPEGGALYIYTPDGQNLIRPFTAEDNEEHGQLWTPMLPGESIVIEVNVPSNQIQNLELELSSVNHGFIGSTPGAVMDFILKSGSCNVDVVCPDGDGWRDQIRSVAAYSTGGGAFCTGGAINSTSNSGNGYFLTADHCGINAQNAPSMVFFWNYQNSTCRAPNSAASGRPGDGQKNQFSTGAIFRAGYQPTDMTLVEFDDPIDPAFGVYLSGWDATSQIPSSATGIHHPNVQEKRISHRNNALEGGSTHLTVPDWDIGTTEPGSSGSPLYNQNKHVVGQLTGGSAACGNNGSDSYGWVYRSWTGGGSKSTRLRDWLDNANTGSLVTEGREASGGSAPNPVPTPVATPVPEPVPTAAPNPTPPPVTPTPVPPQQPTPAPAPGGSGSVLQNGAAVSGVSGQMNSEAFYTFTIPQSARSVTFKMSGGSGDADLYVKFGSKPSLNDFQCRPFLPGNDEMCRISNAQAGTYHVMIQGYSPYSGTSLVANYQQGGGNGGNGNSGINVGQGQWYRHSIEVPPGVSRVVISTSGGTGDADLYVKDGSAPTSESYDCRSWNEDNDETCTIENPKSGIIHVGINGYTAASGINETWRFE